MLLHVENIIKLKLLDELDYEVSKSTNIKNVSYLAGPCNRCSCDARI